MKRPYIDYTLDRLKSVFAQLQDDAPGLRVLREEISCRQSKHPRSAKATLIGQIDKRLETLEGRRQGPTEPNDQTIKAMVREIQRLQRALEDAVARLDVHNKSQSQLQKRISELETENLSLKIQLGRRNDSDDGFPNMTIDQAFDLLEIAYTEDIKEIKLAHRRIIKQYHPDKWPSLPRKLAEFANRHSSLVNRAWSLLNDEFGE